MYQTQTVVKKYLAEILMEKYHDHEAIIDRLAHLLSLPADAESFLRLVQVLYQKGFDHAISSYRDELEKLGYQVTIS